MRLLFIIVAFALASPLWAEDPLEYRAFGPHGGEIPYSQAFIKLLYEEFEAGRSPGRPPGEDALDPDFHDNYDPAPGTPPYAKEDLAERGIPFPEGAGAYFDHITPRWDDWNLISRNTVENHRLLQKYLGSLRPGAPLYIVVQVQIIEVESALASQWVEQEDGGNLLAEAEAMVAKGEAKRVLLRSLETRSGQRSSIREGEQLRWLDRYETDEAGILQPVFEERTVGQSIEIDPVIGSPCFINLSYHMERHLGPAQLRNHVVEFAGKQLTVQRASFDADIVSGGYTTVPGTARLRAIWPARDEDGKAIEGRVDAIFFRMEVGELRAP